MTELGVHRYRIGDWMPSPVKTIASDPFSSLVAIGREDGDIDICDSQHKWHTIACVPGQAEFELRALVWSAVEVEKGRLFGISLKGFIFEVDLEELSFKNVQESYGGSAWCISARQGSPTLVVGSADGSCRLFSYQDGDLHYVKTHPTTGSRILSIAYHPKKAQIFAGCSDGTVRCLDADSGKSLFRITGDLVRGGSTMFWSIIVLSDSTIVTGDNRGHVQLWDGEAGVLMISFHQHTAEVLALAVSPDETQVFASGVDSRVTCIQRLRDRARSGSNLSAAAKISSALSDETSPTDGQWVYTTSHRPHSHDVYSLAVSKGAGEGPLLLSGGMDCKLCVYSIAQFVSVRPVWVLPIPADSITSASQNYSTVALRHRRHVDVWALNPPSPASSSEGKNKSRIKNTSKGKGSEQEKGVSSPALLLRVRLESPEHIHCMSLSPDGNLLVISGAFGTKLWHLKQKESDPSVLKPVPVALPAKARVYCHAATFSGDSTQLALSTAKGSILLVKIAAERGDEGSGEGSAKKDKKKRKNKGQASSDGAAASNGSAASTCGYSASLNHTLPHAETVAEASSGLGRAVSRLSLSPDGMFLAVAACDRGVCVYELDRSSLYWRLPVTSTAGPVASVAFHASDPSRLVLLYSVGGYCVYHLDSMKITDCSIHALRNRSASASDGDDVSASSSSSGDSRLAKLMSKVSGSLHGFCFDSSSAERLYAFGQGVCMLVDTAAGAGVPKKAKSVYPTLFDDDDDASTAISGGGGGGGGDEAGRKRKRGGSDASASSSSSSNFACITSYRSIIHLGCADGHLVVIENPWVKVLERLPATLARKRYGT